LELPGGLDLAADAAAPVSRSGSFPGTPGTCRSHQYGGFARGVKICSFPGAVGRSPENDAVSCGRCPILPSQKSKCRKPVRTSVCETLTRPPSAGGAPPVLTRSVSPCSGGPQQST
jgi:hypothetical protein